MKFFTRRLFLVLTLLSLAGNAHGGRRPARAHDETFALTILQNSKRLTPDKRGRITLSRGPFVLVLQAPLGAGVLLNASRSPTLFSAARAGKQIHTMPGMRPGSGMAESPGNKARELWLRRGGSHYLYAHGKQHRFDRVSYHARHYVGRRGVARLVDLDSKREPIPLTSNRAGPELYLVLLATSSKAAERVERWRAALQLRFR